MNIILVMIPLSFLILLGAGAAFFWAVNHHQFDDMDSPAHLPIDDADKKTSESEKTEQEQNLS